MSSRRGRTACVVVAWLAFLAALILRGRFSVILNSDSSLFPMMGVDLRSWGGHWAEWKVGHIAYTFPDYALYRISNAFVSVPQTALVVAGLLQCSLGLAGWSLLATKMIRDPAARCGVLCLIPALIACQICVPAFNHYFWLEVSLVHHGGILAVAPWSLLVARQAVFAPTPTKRARYATAWIVLGAALVGSDRLSSVQLLAPTAVLVAAVVLRRSIARALLPFVALVAAAGIGVVLEKLLLPQPVYGALRPPGTTFFSVIRTAPVLMRAELETAPVSMLFMIALMLLGALFGVAALVRRRSVSNEERFDRAIAGALPLTSILVVVLVTALAGPAFTLQSQRHVAFPFLAAAHCAPIFLGLALPQLLARLERWFAVATASAAGVFATIGATSEKLVLGLSEAPGGGVIETTEAMASQCINEETAARGLTTGLAEYWDAKLFSLLSGGRVRLVQVDVGFRQYDWVSNVEWGKRFSPEFVLVDSGMIPNSPRPTEAAAIDVFGAPTSMFSCTTVKVLVYQGESQERFRQAWRLLRREPLAVPGDEVIFSGRKLPGNGTLDGESRVASSGDATILSYGPYITLGPGRYHTTIKASMTAAPDESVVGGWDVVLWKPGGDAHIVAKGPLVPGKTPVEAAFHLDESLPVEVRTFYSGKGNLRVESVTIHRDP